MELVTCDRDLLQDDEELLDAVSGIVEDSHLLDRTMTSAERFVYGVEDGDPVSFASLKRERGGGGIELYYLVVDSAVRGTGYGGETFDRALEEAEEMAQDRGYERVYIEVWDDTTDAYHEVKEVVEEEEDYFSDHFLPDHCNELGYQVEDLVDENTAMKYLAESRGFTEVEKKSGLRRTAYERPVRQSVDELPVMADD